MDRFPEFMRDRSNAVASKDRSEGVEGYVFDGANGAQVVLFECAASGVSKEHVHPFDEYFVVIQGEYTLGMQGKQSLCARDRNILSRREYPMTAASRRAHER